MSSGIRTLSQLQDSMSNEFAWRKKELHGLKVLVLGNQSTHNRDLCIRAAVTILYAHWEGIVKHLGTCYLEFRRPKETRHHQLPANFLAMAVCKLIRPTNSKIQQCLDIVSFFQTEMAGRSQLHWRSGIGTKSNLNSAAFREIVLLLGLDYARFATKEKLLDEKLLGNRNRIAHGQYSLVSLDEYLDLHNEVHGMMQDLYDQIDNLAFTGAYQKP